MLLTDSPYWFLLPLPFPLLGQNSTNKKKNGKMGKNEKENRKTKRNETIRNNAGELMNEVWIPLGLCSRKMYSSGVIFPVCMKYLA